MNGLLRTILWTLITLTAAGCNSTGDVNNVNIKEVTYSGGRYETITLLSHTRHDIKIKSALINAGFKVKQRPTQITLTQKSENLDISSNRYEAKYGLNYTVLQKDFCVTSDNVLLDISIELVDLAKNEAILFFEKSGWTGRCGFHDGKIFDELAMILRDQLIK